jgi:hypothetical protein
MRGPYGIVGPALKVRVTSRKVVRHKVGAEELLGAATILWLGAARAGGRLPLPIE